MLRDEIKYAVSKVSGYWRKEPTKDNPNNKRFIKQVYIKKNTDLEKGDEVVILKHELFLRILNENIEDNEVIKLKNHITSLEDKVIELEKINKILTETVESKKDLDKKVSKLETELRSEKDSVKMLLEKEGNYKTVLVAILGRSLLDRIRNTIPNTIKETNLLESVIKNE